MSRVRFIMVGGFLGAGKTTALLRLARRYTEAGKRVGIITNDHGEELVDTATFRTAGFATEEIPSGCFCRRFDELLTAAGRLQDGEQPDVLLAEPVGSGTNLVHTVVKPLEDLYADRFTVAPFVVLLDPQRAFKALTGTGRAGFSAKVTYLYKMQQNEADVVAINKADTLTAARREELMKLVGQSFPKADMMVISARTGEGFDQLAAALEPKGASGRNALDLDAWDRSLAAEADADLAWLNLSWPVSAADGFGADRLLLDLADAIREALAEVEAEPAHVKMILRRSDDVAIANLVGSDRAAELSRASRTHMTDATLIVNARVEIDPSVLRERVEEAVRAISAKHGVDVTNISISGMASETSRTMRDLEAP